MRIQKQRTQLFMVPFALATVMMLAGLVSQAGAATLHTRSSAKTPGTPPASQGLHTYSNIRTIKSFRFGNSTGGLRPKPAISCGNCTANAGKLRTSSRMRNLYRKNLRRKLAKLRRFQARNPGFKRPTNVTANARGGMRLGPRTVRGVTATTLVP